MKIKIGECLEIYGNEENYGCLRKILKCEMPAVKAFEYLPLVESIKKIIADYKKIETEKIISFGHELPGGGHQVKRENLNKYAKEINELLSKEVDVSDIKINLNELPNAVVSPDDLPLLQKFIVLGDVKEETKKKK